MGDDALKDGFRMVDHTIPPPEEVGNSLGLFLPRDSVASLQKLTDDEHKFLQALLMRLSAGLQALQGAENKEGINKLMSSIGDELSAAVKLKSLDRGEAHDLVVNMVSAIAASGVRCLFLSLLHKSYQPKEEEK